MPNFPYVREAFKDMVGAIFASAHTLEQCKAFSNARFDVGGKIVSANELCGMLWNCTDVCPRDTCETADLPHDLTYGQVARNISHFFALKAVA